MGTGSLKRTQQYHGVPEGQGIGVRARTGRRNGIVDGYHGASRGTEGFCHVSRVILAVHPQKKWGIVSWSKKGPVQVSSVPAAWQCVHAPQRLPHPPVNIYHHRTEVSCRAEDIECFCLISVNHVALAPQILSRRRRAFTPTATTTSAVFEAARMGRQC